MSAQTTTPPEGNGWYEYQKLVLHELREHSQEFETVRAELQKLHVSVAALNVKSGVWGLVGGLLAATLALVAAYMGK